MDDLDGVRLMIGDTDTGDPLLTDDEVEYFIGARTVTYDDYADEVNLPAAAADCAGAIAAEFARSFNFSEDGQRFDVSQRVSHYMTLERELRNRSGGVAVTLAGTATAA